MVTPGIPTPEQFKEQQRQLWSEAASPWRVWQPQFAEMSRAATELIVRLARVTPGMQVLDLASGTGEPALTLAAAVAPGGHVTATDLVPEMLTGIEDIARGRSLTNLSTRQADMESLPFPDAGFDVVTSRFGIMFPPTTAKALAEIRRTLKPGGRAAFLVWDTPEQPYFAVTQGPFARRAQLPPPPPGAPSPFRFAAHGSLSTALRSAGFQQVEETAQTIPWAWPGPPEELWRAQQEFVSFMYRSFREALSPEQQAAADREVLESLRMYYDGRWTDTTAKVIGASGVR